MSIIKMACCSLKMISAFLGTIGIVLGIGTLRFSWRRKTRLHSFIILGGWMLILGGIVLWGQVGGTDWGVAMGTILFISVAMILLGFNALTAFMNRKSKQKTIGGTNKLQVSDETPRGVYAKYLSTFFLAAPIGGGVAIILTLSVFELLQSLGVETANSTVTTFFLAPLLWTAIATWMVIDNAIMRKVALLFCCAALGTLHLGWVE